jgi:predicted DNA-binding transcriptional regulator AlpA
MGCLEWPAWNSPGDRAELIDADTAATLIGVSRATWDRMRSAGMVPQPVKLNNGSIIRWRRAELVKWIEDGCPASE